MIANQNVKAILLILILTWLGGCQTTPIRPASHGATSHPFEAVADVPPGEHLAVPHVLHLVQLDVYQMEMPFGSISDNPSFWSRIDQTDINASARSILAKNGFRVGQGLIYDWPYFRDILNQHPVSTWMTSRVAYSEQHEQLLVKKNQLPRNLFYFNTNDELIGRSFGEAEYELMLSFWPSPKHHGQVHIQLLPVVQPDRQKLQHYWIDGHDAVRIVRPQYFYDLDLQTDLPVDHFLIIAPSPHDRLQSTLGNAFLVNAGPTMRTETIFIFVARPIGGASLMAKQK